MTPETEAAARVLAYTTTLGTLHATADPRLLALGAAGLGGLAWLLRPTPQTPSVHPSAPAPAGAGAPGMDGPLGGRILGGATDHDQAEGVWSRGEPPPKAWAVEGLVPHGPRRPWWAFWCPRRGYVTTLLGAGGVGKSYLLLDLGIAALTDGEWLGQSVRRVRRVLYVDAELDVEECRRRAYPLARGRGLPKPPRGLHYLHLSRSLAAVRERDVVRPGYGLEIVRREARRVRADLILFDSLTIGSAGASLSDQNGWNRILGGMEAWGVPVVCIDHMGKDASRGAAGSFMKQAKVRSVLTLTLKGGLIHVAHEKSNFGPKHPPFAVQAQRIGPPLSPTCVRYEPLGGAAPAAPAPPSQTEGGAADEQPAPLPLPVQQPPDPTSILRERAYRALLPALTGDTGESEGWVTTGRLVKALEAAGVCKRSAGYALLASLAGAGRLERQGPPELPARAYRLPPPASETGELTALGTARRAPTR